MARRGVLLLNVGTPSAPTLPAIWRYLNQFLTDYRIIPLPALLRFMLVNFVIIPRRIIKVRHAYRSIWQNKSPLLLNSEAIAQSLQLKLGDNYQVQHAMRYGNPSIEKVMQQFKELELEHLTVIPLFPQYAAATSSSAIAKTLSYLQDYTVIPNLKVINNFYNHPLFIEAQAELMQQQLEDFSPDQIIFSFHGLPVRELHKVEAQSCSQNTICPAITAGNKNCYKAQAVASARALAQKLKIPEGGYSISFQSRLGKLPWIGPYTEEVITACAQQGVKKLLVVCPSFVADCLETLEEIAIGYKELFLSLGGAEFKVTPCVNNHPLFIEYLAAECSGSA